MSTRVEVLLWAQRVVARKHAPPNELLEIKDDATLEQAQEAFHKLARMAHPDLHRTTLEAAELENVTTAYAYSAAAYQAIRSARLRGVTGMVAAASTAPAPEPEKAPPAPASDRMRRPSEVVRLPGGGVSARAGGATRPPLTRPAGTTHPPAVASPPARGRPTGAPPVSEARTAPPESTPVSPSAAMNGKALVYYRKAESALRQGDLRMAVLSLKLAIASDPGSAFLRQAMAEVAAELNGTK